VLVELKEAKSRASLVAVGKASVIVRIRPDPTLDVSGIFRDTRIGVRALTKAESNSFDGFFLPKPSTFDSSWVNSPVTVPSLESVNVNTGAAASTEATAEM